MHEPLANPLQAKLPQLPAFTCITTHSRKKEAKQSHFTSIAINPSKGAHNSHVTMLVPKPLILFIDAYDSFSNNIISLLETTLGVSVRTIKIDNPALASDAALHEELRHYAAVVCGPGPGHPEKEEDVGIMRRIWRLSDEELLPVLGICLGFQSLCLEFGGEVKRLKGPQHGMIRRITHIGESADEEQQSIFGGVGEIKATLYQSLCADIGQDSILPDSWNSQKWDATGKCPQLLPLAWVESSLIPVCYFLSFPTYVELLMCLSAHVSRANISFFRKQQPPVTLTLAALPRPVTRG